MNSNDQVKSNRDICLFLQRHYLELLRRATLLLTASAMYSTLASLVVTWILYGRDVFNQYICPSITMTITIIMVISIVLGYLAITVSCWSAYVLSSYELRIENFWEDMLNFLSDRILKCSSRIRLGYILLVFSLLLFLSCLFLLIINECISL